MITKLPTRLDPQSFVIDGFTMVDDLIDQDCLRALRQAYDDIIAGKRDCGEDDRHLGGLTRQVMHPSAHHPLFASNQALEQGMEIARQLMGWEKPCLHFDMLINKTPGNLNATPWHQDAAYGAMPIAPAGSHLAGNTLQFWVALDDVDTENGCMHFSRGQSIHELLPHRVFSGDPEDEGRLLALCDDVRIENSVACPLPAGAATVHLEGTLHMTTPNTTTDRQRRAYIFNLSDGGQKYLE